MINFDHSARTVGGKRATVAILLILSPLLLKAQGCCSGGTPLAGTIGLEYLPKGDLRVELNYDYNLQGDLLDGSLLLEQNPRRRRTHAVLLGGSFATSERLSIAVLLSAIRQEEITISQNGGRRSLKSQGIGDAILFGQYALTRGEQRMKIVGGAGLNIPLGRTQAVNADTGLPLHPDLQAGTGAWDILMGVRATYPLVYGSPLNLINHITYRLTTPGTRYLGRQQYEFGNEFRWLSGLSSSITTPVGLITPSFLVLFRTTARDRTNQLPAPNTGGYWWHIRPGLGLSPNPALSFNCFGELPVTRELNEVQLTTSFRFRLSMTYQFSTRQAPTPTILSAE